LVEVLLRHPLEAVSVVRGLGLRLADPRGALADRVRLGAEALGAWRGGEKARGGEGGGDELDLERMLLEARRSQGRTVSPREAARLRGAVAALPPPVREGAARILAAQRAATRLLATALGGLSQREGAELVAWLQGKLPASSDADDPVHRRALDRASRIDRAALYAAAWIVADAVDRALPDLLQGSRDSAVSRAPNALLLDEPTPWGRVVIAGAGPNRHAQDALLLIDLGGDDEYMNNAGGTAGRLGTTAVAIDLGGNDRYRTTRGGAQGAGVLGVGVLVDVSGDDTYEGGSLAQGAGAFGVGILVDRAGNDRYAAGAMAQGAGGFGLGFLADGAGNDQYRARTWAQAFGYVAGLGALLEAGGDDAYTLAGGPEDPRQAGHTQSFGQGMGLGLRPHAAGGIGFLMDMAGNDVYRGDFFAQGVGFWFALGGLADEAGDDRYVATRYAQGAGIHLGVGVLADGAGNDLYEAHGVAQGVGHDWGAGFLVDVAGDDRYAAVSLAQGAGSSNGVGILADVRGRDSLAVPGSTVQGCGVPSRGYASVGLLLMDDAAVLGLPGVLERATRRCGELGFTFSALGLPAGIAWAPAPLPAGGASMPAEPPLPPSARASAPAWPPRTEKQVMLLRQAADPAESAEAEARRRAARRALLADPGALDVLLAALHREDPAIVNAALDLLAAMGSPAARPAADLLRQKDLRLRRRGAWVLKAVASGETRGPLLEAARADGDPVVRGYALEALRSWVMEPEVRAVLLAVLGGESEWIVRLGAARGLEGAEDADALAALAAGLGDAHFAVRGAAREALAAAGAGARPVLVQRAAGGDGDTPAVREVFARRHARALLQHLEEGAK
jgi:hypothetical protein